MGRRMPPSSERRRFSNRADLLLAKGPRLGVEADARDRGRRDGRRLGRRCDHLPTAVEELHEEPSPVGPHRSSNAPVAADDAVDVPRQRVRGQEPGLVHRLDTGTS